MGSDEGYFGERVAAAYDERSASMFDPAVLLPAVERLAELAGDGGALEFAVGTGRIALPLAERGVRVTGIDNSEAMLARLRAKPGAERVEAVAGDMAATRLEGEFSLVYLVFNAIFNLTTQDGQVACFENAAAHLSGGGRFVIEARVPELQRLPLGQTVLPWRADPGRMSTYVYDVVTQRLSGTALREVEDAARLHPAREHVVEQLGDVGPRRRRPAADALVAEEHVTDRQLDAVRDAHVAHHRPRPRDRDRRLHGLAGADAFERGVDPDAAGEREDRLGRLLAALGDDVGRTERPGELLADRVAAERDDPLGAQALCRQDARQADRAVADHRDDAPAPHLRADRRVMAGRHDVGERQQRGEHLVGVAGAADADERAVRQRHPHRFALAAVDALGCPEPTVGARGRDAVEAVRAGPVAEGEGSDDEVAFRDGADLGADVLDDADELVPDRAGCERGVAAVVPEVRPADAGEHDADDRVGRVGEPRVHAPTLEVVDTRTEIREFLTSRRAKVTPEQAGLPVFGGPRRVPGLRREEVAILAGVSVDYYTRLERGSLKGASESVLEALARALQLDEAERAHLFDLARAAGPATVRPRRRPAQARIRPSVQRMLDAMTGAPAHAQNGRLDILAANPLGRALYAPMYDDPAGPNHARFAFLDARAPAFYGDWERG